MMNGSLLVASGHVRKRTGFVERLRLITPKPVL